MNRDRVRAAIAAAILLAALGAVMVWLVQSTEWVEVKVPRRQPGPETFDPDYRLSRILHRLDVLALRFEHFEGLPAKGTTLLLRGWRWQSFPDIDQQILDWVEAGGHLVLPIDGFSDDPNAKPVWLPIAHLHRRNAPHARVAPSAGTLAAAPARTRGDPPAGSLPGGASAGPKAKAQDCARLREFPPEATSFPADAVRASPAPANPASGAQDAADATRNSAPDDRESDDGESDGSAPEEADATTGVAGDAMHQEDADAGVDTLLLCVPGAASTQTWIRTGGATWALGVSPDVPRSVRVALGAGTVTATQDAYVFSNDAILQGENTLVALALLQARPGHLVWIVDGSGGLGLAAWIWREAYPAVLLAAVALLAALWRVVPRFGRIEAAPPLARRSVREQIRGTSLYLWRDAPASLLEASARALDEAARRKIPAYDGADIDARIDALARFAHCDPRSIRSALPQTGGVPDRRDLARRLGVLESVRRILMQREVR